MIKNIFLNNLGLKYYSWNKKNPIGQIPLEVAREGAGENRIPFAHYANSLPVYLTLSKVLIESKKNKASILDLGCGTGRNISFVKALVNKKNYQYFGLDYSSACINYARKQYRKQQVILIQYQGKVLPFPDESFDFIISSHVLEHISKEDSSLYLNEIGRILKKSGLAIIGTPNRKYCQDLFMINPSDKKKFRLILPHEHEFYYSELKKLFSSNKIFNNFKIFGTINNINRKLMILGSEKIKLKKGFFHKLKFEIYSMIRQFPTLQDLMAKVGTEYLLWKMKVDYKKVITTTYLTSGLKTSESDNFIVIAYR